MSTQQIERTCSRLPNNRQTPDIIIMLIIGWVAFALSAYGVATNRYVATNSPSSGYPFDSWDKAATNIKDAVDAGNYRLSANSPCVNTGTNQFWMTDSCDLDGRTRICYGTVDMGAYERIYDGTIYTLH